MKSNVTIRNIQDYLWQGSSPNYIDDDTSRRMWWCAIEIIQKEFLIDNHQNVGIWVASPLPVINEKQYLRQFAGWLWAPEGFPYFNYDYAGYLPHDGSKRDLENNECFTKYKILKLSPEDGYEPFLMIITQTFQCILTISGEKNKKTLIMRSDEQSLRKVIQLIDTKMRFNNPEEADNFKTYLNSLGNLKINYEFSQNFWPTLSSKLAGFIPSINFQTSEKISSNKSLEISEAKLLEAISHEVRTPLATIRTLISSTLKKYNMDQTIRNRLKEIDNECTEQIDRFGLIFNAAELVSGESSPPQQLASIDLGDILQKLLPFWVNQLKRRGISLRVEIPDDLPKVLSNSEKLELMLRGLIDKNTRGLKEGSLLILELRPAGQKIKLQLRLQKKDKISRDSVSYQVGSDIGPVLNWDPQTGSLQLSQSAMQKLLASLGGHITNRRDTGLTVFFPISPGN